MQNKAYSNESLRGLIIVRKYWGIFAEQQQGALFVFLLRKAFC